MNDPYGLILSGLPPDVAAKAMGLSSRQAIMQALMQQSMGELQAPETKGRFQGRISPLSGLAKVAQAVMGMQGQQDIAKQAGELGKEYQGSVTDAILNSQTARMGTPARPEIPVPADELGGGPGQAAQPAKPGNASVANALLMQNPMTRQLGQTLMQRDLEMQMVKDTMGSRGGGGASAGAPAAAGGGGVGGGGSMPPIELLAAGPLGDSVFKALEERSKGIATRPGAPVVNPYTGAVIAQPTPAVGPGIQLSIPPGGGPATAAPVPGAAAATAGMVSAETTAKEAAKFPFEVREVKQADGSTRPMLVSPITGSPGAAPAGPSAMTIPPEVSAAAAAGKPFVATQAPGEAPKMETRGTATDPWSSMPKMAVPSGVGQSTYQETIAKQQGEAAAKLSEKYGAQADVANQRKALNNQALGLIDKADTGPMAGTIADVKNWLVSRAGVPEGDFENTPTATIALQKDLLNAATQRAKQQFGSRITQQEVMLMLSKGSPNVDMTKEAMKYLIGSDNIAADYSVQQSNDLGRYLQHGGDPMRFEGWHAQAFPMAHSLEKLHVGDHGVAGSAAAAPALTATGPRGEKLILKDGKWQPLK